MQSEISQDAQFPIYSVNGSRAKTSSSSSNQLSDMYMNEIYITYKRNLGDILCTKSCSQAQRLIFQIIMINASAKYYERVVNRE